MVIRPWGMGIWDLIREELDRKIKAKEVPNAYFPLMIPQSFFGKEAQHVDGFAKEVAVVTHSRLKIDNETDNRIIPDPESKLEVSSSH